ncbi:hypothetical protein Q0F99_15060 [Rathayibacter oskolensis]|uniref:hypothetical protein n=1 Tax=Rathayibacter oskolensis TaxID=1891671 RepID=UPI00265F5AA1|nr:hypothetical protein [Rathayibacter oskolensis]WKK70994.1 hypothetical protein Q0F99_15060 [Rathayibacter oskolensis]
MRASRAGDADDDLPDELREDDEDDDDETSEAEAAAASSVLLVATGVTAGLYLLYTIGWMITATRQNATITTSFSGTLSVVRCTGSVCGSPSPRPRPGSRRCCWARATPGCAPACCGSSQGWCCSPRCRS